MPVSEKTGRVRRLLERLSGYLSRKKDETLHNSRIAFASLKDKTRDSFKKGLAKLRNLHTTENYEETQKGESSVQKQNEIEPSDVRHLNSIQRFAYYHLSPSLPTLPGYREAYDQAGLSLLYESYLSSALLLSLIATVPTFALSLIFEIRVLRVPLSISIVGSVVLGAVVFLVSLLIWLLYPLERRRNFKSKLEYQLAYSFGIFGALAASGISVERLFEKLAATETNPVLTELARRFLRDVKIFGLDTESALREVASHSPSIAFSKILENIAVAFHTTGSIHDLVMFESSRLFAEKRDKLSKNISDLAVMGELYITLVVVGPIMFIVLLSVLIFLPNIGTSLAPPTAIINLLVFVGIPVFSIMFALLLDSTVAKM